MAEPQLLAIIDDFSSGEVDPDIKRGTNAALRTGGRQMSNWRVLNSLKKANRPGRSPLFLETGRVEEVLMFPGNHFFLVFNTANHIRVYNAAGTLVFDAGAANPVWPSLGSITFAIDNLTIYIAYPGVQPLTLTWDGASQTSTWTIGFWAPTITASGQRRVPFFRISPQNVTMQPSGTGGNINLTFSSAILVSGMIGTRMRYCNRQILITGVTASNFSTPVAGPSQFGTATVIEPLPGSQGLTFSASSGFFEIGDVLLGANTGASGVVIQTGGQQSLTFNTSGFTGIFPGIGDHLTGSPSGATGIVVASFPGSPTESVLVTLTSGTFGLGDVVTDSTTGGSGTTTAVGGGSLVVQIIPNASGDALSFAVGEVAVGPNGNGTISGSSFGNPGAVSIWDDEMMNSFRGYPFSVFFDQNRLGFCNFPALPSAIAWSAIGLPNDFYTGALADNSIFDLAPGKSQVLFVQPGMESSEFVFCDNAIYYVPISPTNPLTPGTVAFQLLSEQGCFPNVRPQPAEQTILYVKAGGLSVGAVQAPGAYYRPYVIDDVSEFHTHLFSASPVVAIAVPNGSVLFQELYAYILLANGTLVTGKYGIRNGLLDVGQEGKPKIGWLPWNGAGAVSWISAQASDVVFTTSYAPNGVPAVSVVEKLDSTQYLDGALLVNNLPAPFAPPGGKGPLFNFPGPNSTVTLIDQGTRFMGTYQVDSNGFLIPQNIGGENLASTALVAGQPWTATYEPFIQHPPAGPDNRQGTRRIKISRSSISVQNSTGFTYASTRIPAYFVGDDATQPAKLRESTYRLRVPGRFFDPRVPLTKDTPGPLVVNEYRIEGSV